MSAIFHATSEGILRFHDSLLFTILEISLEISLSYKRGRSNFDETAISTSPVGGGADEEEQGVRALRREGRDAHGRAYVRGARAGRAERQLAA